MTRRTLMVLTIIGSLTGPAIAETVDGSRLYVLDGDTVALGRERIRIANIDAPEIFHVDCDAELQYGLAAKDVLAEILRGRAVAVTRWKRKDPYGRTLATLTTREGDVGDQLIASTRTFHWKPGAEAKAWRIAQWCKR